MKKNSYLHLRIETECFEVLKKEALEENISISELCRKKLKENSKLTQIKSVIEDISKKLNLLIEKNEQ